MYLFQSSVWQCVCVSMNVNAMRTYTLVLRVVQVRLWTCFRCDKMVVVCFGLMAFPSCCCFCWFCCVLRANYQANGEFIRCVFVWINSPHPLETKRHSTVQKAFFALCKAFYPFTKNYLQQQQQQQQKTYTYVRKKGIHLFDVSYEHFWKLQFSIVAIAVWINTHKNGRVP